jgi:hypothetical protein
MVEWSDYKRKGYAHEKSRHEKYGCDEMMDHSNDNPYIQDYTPKTHTQLTEQSAWSAHEVQAGHSTCIQKLEDDHI